MSIIIGIDHGYYAIKTAHCSFPAGLTSYGEHEPYTRQGLLEFGGCFFVCGTGRQPIQRDKTANDNYYLLTLAAIAKEIRQRGLPPECSVRIAAGLPLTSFGRDKPKFRDYLLRSKQPVNFRFEGVEYSITIEEVAIFPQGYAALMTETGLLQDVIAKQIRRYQQELDDAKAEYAELQNARLNEAAEIRKLRTYYDDFKGWAEEFDTAPLEMKRMILSHLIDRVEVGRKYQVIVKFNMKYRQFLECTAETYNTEIGA